LAQQRGNGTPVDPASASGRGNRSRSRATGARLSDVAHAAGVSQQTVSNVLNGRTGFTEETRGRVLAAAKELDYSPNRAAQRLRSSRSRQLGLHLPADQLTVSNTFSISFLRAVIAAAEAAEQQLVVLTHPLGDRSATPLLRAGVDGFVLCNVAEGDPRPRALADMGLPFALMGRLEPSLPQCCVDIDNAAAMIPVVDHLVAQGHRRFAYVGYEGPQHWEVGRLTGTVDRLRHHGFQIPEPWLVRGTTDTIAELIGTHLLAGNPPDAVICASDSLAIRVHGALISAGLRPGKDVALTGFDGLPLPIDLDPPLTSVRIPVEAIAASVIDLLVRQIEGEPAPDEGFIVPTELALGGTA
jgi:DNA-binding LacI/PurR family transcriptional regulator